MDRANKKATRKANTQNNEKKDPKTLENAKIRETFFSIMTRFSLNKDSLTHIVDMTPASLNNLLRASNKNVTNWMRSFVWMFKMYERLEEDNIRLNNKIKQLEREKENRAN